MAVVRKAKRKNTKPVAVHIMDRHDENFFMGKVRKFSRSGGAHIYRHMLNAGDWMHGTQPGERWELFIVSPTLLSPKEVIQQAGKYFEELNAQ